MDGCDSISCMFLCKNIQDLEIQISTFWIIIHLSFRLMHVTEYILFVLLVYLLNSILEIEDRHQEHSIKVRYK